MPQRNQSKENFFFTTGWSVAMAAAAATATVNILIAADAPFLCYRVSGHVRQGAAGTEVTVLNFGGDVQINESQLNRNLFNLAGAMDMFVAPGAPPYDLTPPRLFAANSTIIVTFTSNVATRTQCQIILHGAKVYGV